MVFTAGVPAREPRHVHFLGIGGSGLSALAHIQLARGDTVSGSDQEDSPRVSALRAAGARVRTGPAADPAALAAEFDGVDVVVASSALPDDHPEVLAARAAGVPLARRSEWLPALTAGFDLVAVAGSHGKTTTSSMLTVILRAAGLDPTAVIGAEVPALAGRGTGPGTGPGTGLTAGPGSGTGGIVGAGRVFVLEADEYGGAFAGLEPLVAVVTNVEWEHPDLFPDAAAVRTAFAGFLRRVRPGSAGGRMIVCFDDPGARATVTLAAETAAVTEAPALIGYGLAEAPAPGWAPRWRAVNVSQDAAGAKATITRDGCPVATLSLALPGEHMVRNALAAVAAAAELGVDPATAAAALGTFTGAARRFTPVGALPAAPGRHGPVEVIDDYAHHPTEIRATLAAARARAGERAVWAIVQPHTYSRLAALLDDFAEAFSSADRVYVTDIYAAREKNDLGLHARQLAERITAPADVAYVAWADLVGRLTADAGAGTAPTGLLILTLGAGTITAVGPAFLAGLSPSSDGSGREEV